MYLTWKQTSKLRLLQKKMFVLQFVIDKIYFSFFSFSFLAQGSVMFAKTASSEDKSEDLEFHCRHLTSVNLCCFSFHFLFSACWCLCLFLSSPYFSLPLSLWLSLHPHTQTQTNTAVTVAYYSGQVRACRWGLLNAGATAHQCLRNRGTCCDHRWRLAIYTHTCTDLHTPTSV